jgi:hypothetical protein
MHFVPKLTIGREKHSCANTSPTGIHDIAVAETRILFDESEVEMTCNDAEAQELLCDENAVLALPRSSQDI